jgi:hypothetical protein
VAHAAARLYPDAVHQLYTQLEKRIQRLDKYKKLGLDYLADYYYDERRTRQSCGLARAPLEGAGFVIALHSPSGVVETGLRVCPPEKKAW